MGSHLNAVIYSFLNNIPLILTAQQEVHQFEFFPPEIDLNSLCVENVVREIKVSGNKTKTIGISKEKVWKHLIFLLSLKGLCPLSNKVHSVRVGEEVLKIFSENSRLMQIKFDDICFFSGKGVEGLEIESSPKKKYKVVDWFKVKSGSIHPIDQIQDEKKADFVKEIIFFPSRGESSSKNLVAISYMEEEQLNDIYYSDLFVKFKVLKLMEETGIKGRKNGKLVEKGGRQKYLSLDIDSRRRDVTLITEDIFQEAENVKFNYQTEEEILKESHVSLSGDNTSRWSALRL